MGKKVYKKCICCPRESKKRKHGDFCPACGGKLKSKASLPKEEIAKKKGV